MATGFPTSLETRAALPTGVPVPRGSDATTQELLPFLQWAMDAIVALEAKVGADSSAVTTSLDYKASSTRLKRTLVSESFDLDNGAGTTVDRVLCRMPFNIFVVAARIVYDDATSGTVAAGTMQLGSTVGGSDLAGPTNYENAKAVGTTTTFAVTGGGTAWSANSPIIARHTGVAATQAGRAHVELDYYIT